MGWFFDGLIIAFLSPLVVLLRLATRRFVHDLDCSDPEWFRQLVAKHGHWTDPLVIYTIEHQVAAGKLSRDRADILLGIHPGIRSFVEECERHPENLGEGIK